MEEKELELVRLAVKTIGLSQTAREMSIPKTSLWRIVNGAEPSGENIAKIQAWINDDMEKDDPEPSEPSASSAVSEAELRMICEILSGTLSGWEITLTRRGGGCCHD